MSKNLTRKGLALGAVVALASTVIAGSPAFAAGEVLFAPTTGTSYTTFTTDDFALSASLAPGQVAGNIAQLAYHIAGDATGAFEYTTGAVAADATTATTATAQVVRPTVTVGAVNVLNIGLKAADQVAATATKSVVVTAFIDSNNDSVLDAGEFQQARTITFKKLADVVATVTLTAPLPGDTTVKATAVLADINAEQTAASTKVTFTAGSQSLTAAPGVAAATAGSYSEAVSALAATNVVTARVYFGSDALGAAAVTATVPAVSIAAPLSGPVTSANAVAAVAVAGGTNATVRTNSAFAVEATIKSSATGNAVVAGKAVTAAITVSGSLTSASVARTLSINGTVYNGVVALPTALALTTDANGKAKLDLITAGFAEDQTVTVVFKSENQTATTVATLKDAAYTVVSSAVGSALRSIDEAGSTTLNYSVKDQFGVAIGSGARLKFTVGYTTEAITYVALSSGAASITVTDTTANIVSAIPVDARLQLQTVADSNWSAGTIVAAQQTVNVSAVALAFDFAPAAGSVALSTDATITGSVSRPGAAVTVASKGVTFTVGGVEYADTVTLFSGADGDVSISAKSDISGARTITWTSGSVVKTAVLTVAAAGETTGTDLTLDAPATIVPGRTLLVTGKLVDKFGNAVDILTTAATLTVSYTGPGLLVGSLPTSTDADGTFSFRVLLGADEIGSAVVSATYDSNGATADVAGTTVVKTVAKTITIGAAATVAANSAKIASKNGRVYVTVNAAAGFKAYVKVGFSVKPSFTTAGSKLVSYYVGAGKRVAVRVYVRGGIVASQAVTVK